ncbi:MULTISPECIES: EpsD family peptidyl-prolyl cis-trans isomerase [Methylocaldum]|jgi:peptidyl-prolyl cis-trans isomerase C|uniref:EpsD family peptidyl-prolyl cis-trans isomerase n=1 Tax=Methylocaldum sp. TaxID=1969727 RepID=UPI00098B721D|nr:peptidyl-prolyl cis-trans isomerase, EpsD family [Methylocaldum sp. BRCS4]
MILRRIVDRKIWLRSLPLSAHAILALLSACDSQFASDKTTQIVARVNGDDISVGQLDVLLSGSATRPDSEVGSIWEKSIDSLINQQLLSKQAIEKHLDRDPRVTLATAMAERQVLAQAYLDHIAQAVAKPDPAEISAFYKSHPQLFEKRKIYELQQISIPLTPENNKLIDSRLKQPVRFNALSKWLHEQNIPHTLQTVIRPAEHLPLEKLDEFDRLNKGDAVSFKAGDEFLVLQLLTVKEAPLDHDKATPLIESFLTNQRRITQINRELSRLRETATVEYFGGMEPSGNTLSPTDSGAEFISNNIPPFKTQ